MDIARQVGARGPAICCNGAIVLDLESSQISKHFPLPASVSARIVSQLRDSVPGVVFAWELGLSFGREPGYDAIARPLTDDEKEICALDDVVSALDVPLAKLIARHPTFDFDELHNLVGGIARNEAEVTVSSRIFVEISAAGVNKASALRLICDDMGIVAEEVVAIGDMPNDLPMLNWAGRGIAMANAHPMVLAEAREATASNLEDGVALVLESLLD